MFFLKCLTTSSSSILKKQSNHLQILPRHLLVLIFRNNGFKKITQIIFIMMKHYVTLKPSITRSKHLAANLLRTEEQKYFE